MRVEDWVSRLLSVSSLVYSSLVSCVPAPEPSQWLPAGNLGRLSGGTPRRPWRQRDLNPRLVRPSRTRAAHATHVPREPGPKFHHIYRTIRYLILPQSPSMESTVHTPRALRTPSTEPIPRPLPPLHNFRFENVVRLVCKENLFFLD